MNKWRIFLFIAHTVIALFQLFAAYANALRGEWFWYWYGITFAVHSLLWMIWLLKRIKL